LAKQGGCTSKYERAGKRHGKDSKEAKLNIPVDSFEYPDYHDFAW
jgi:hypothetical protein